MLTTLIPLALVVSVSPLSVIPAVLVLQTPRPRPTSLAFLGGWLLGLTALTAVFVASSDAPRWLAQETAGLGILATRRPWIGADRLRHLSTG